MTTDVSVVVPFSANGCKWRAAAWRWLQIQFAQHHPDWELVVGESDVSPYSRAQAIRDGVRRASGSVLVVSDADCWSAGTAEAVARVRAEAPWAVPHRLVHRLSPDSTRRVFDGADWRGLPLSEDNPQDRKPYVGNETGTLVVVHRDALDQAPPDPRHRGWGQEDASWRLMLRCLVGPPWRGDADCFHLWHPPQPRKNRVVGNDGNQALYKRYVRAKNDRTAMRALRDEVAA